MNRREFMALTAAGLASSALGQRSGNAGNDQAAKMKIKAIAFDAFPIFDPRPVFALAEELFPGNGMALSDEWRTRQFEYTWLRVVAQRYADFWQVTEDALVFAAEKLKLDLSAEKREKLMSGYLNLKGWPDVPPALSALRKSGLRLAFLSNLTQHMLQATSEAPDYPAYLKRPSAQIRHEHSSLLRVLTNWALNHWGFNGTKSCSWHSPAGMRQAPACLATRHSG